MASHRRRTRHGSAEDAEDEAHVATRRFPSRSTRKEHIDWYRLVPEKHEYDNPNAHRVGIKHPFSMAIAGPTGCGKTQLLLDLIHHLGCFDRIIVFCRLKTEPLYELLRDHYDGDVLVTNDPDELKELNAEEVEEEEVKNPDQTLMVFDDIIAQPTRVQNLILSHFISSRKTNRSCVVLGQSFFKIPRPVRLQCSKVILMKELSPLDVINAATELAPGHVALFRSLYNAATAPSERMGERDKTDKKLHFLFVDLHAPMEKRFRRHLLIKGCR